MTIAENESAEQRYQRSIQTYQEAQREEKRHWERLGFHRATAPGQPYPLIDDEFRLAMAQANLAEAVMVEAAHAVARERKQK